MPRENDRHLIVAAIARARRLERRGTTASAPQAVQAREELEVLPRGQLGIEVQLVRQHADARRGLPRRPRRGRAAAIA